MALSRTLVELFGRRALNQARSEDTIAWAVASLEQGFDTPSLRILAGLDLTRPIDSFEVQTFFQKALGELELTEPGLYEAILQYADLIVNDLLDGAMDPKPAVSLLARLWAAADYPVHLAVWSDLEDSLEALECGESYVLYPGLTKENRASVVEREARFHLRSKAFTYPPDFSRNVYCNVCGRFGPPSSERLTMKWLPPRWHAWLFGKPQPARSVCGACGASDLTFAWTYEGRRRFIEALEKTGR
jgi:hypothetical protein